MVGLIIILLLVFLLLLPLSISIGRTQPPDEIAHRAVEGGVGCVIFLVTGILWIFFLAEASGGDEPEIVLLLLLSSCAFTAYCVWIVRSNERNRQRRAEKRRDSGEVR